VRVTTWSAHHQRRKCKLPYFVTAINEHKRSSYTSLHALADAGIFLLLLTQVSFTLGYSEKQWSTGGQSTSWNKSCVCNLFWGRWKLRNGKRGIGNARI